MKPAGLVSLESSKHMIGVSLWLANATKSKAVQSLNNIFIDAWYAEPPPPPDAGAIADGSTEDVEDSSKSLNFFSCCFKNIWFETETSCFDLKCGMRLLES